MEIGWEEAVDYTVVGPVLVYFCCTGCAHKFRDDPVGHVDVGAWLGEEPPVVDQHACDGESREVGPPERARKSISRAAVPRIGRHTIDEVDALVVRRWQRLLGPDGGSTLRARVVERALLLRAVARTEEDLAYADRAMAAEVVRLRSRDPDRNRIRRELDELANAFGAVLVELEVDPAELVRVQQRIATGLDESRTWVLARPRVRPHGSWPSTTTRKEGAGKEGAGP
jgi:hypothetical protein